MQENDSLKSAYIHIPFCKNICSYCDFCKNFYDKKIVMKYLYKLEEEIKEKYNGCGLKTLYIGGGTPSCLDIEELNRLLKIIDIFNLEKDYEFTFECNYEDITKEKLELLKQMKVNRLSVGIQSFNDKFSKFLNRKINYIEMKKNILLCKKYFDNISVDLMFGLENQSFEDIKIDIKKIASLDIKHVSVYSLIKEEHTKLYIDNYKEIDDDILNRMYYFIIDELKKYGFYQYEISNFSKKGYESKHNMTYWKNNRYYGFGAGASGFILNTRYNNTKSIYNYLNNNFIVQNEVIDNDQLIKDEVMLNLRMTCGINKEEFKDKYNCDIKDIFDLQYLLSSGFLKENKTSIYIPKKYLFVSSEIILKIIE